MKGFSSGKLQLIVWATLLFGVSFSACNKHPRETNPQPLIHQPVTLQFAETEIWPEDYFPPDIAIDSVVIEGVTLSSTGKPFIYTTPPGFPTMGMMQIYGGSLCVDVPLKKSAVVEHVFQFDPQKGDYQTVHLKGEFNGWVHERNPLEWVDGVWKTTLMLTRGDYQYLLVADGKEMVNPNAGELVDNNMGGVNSLLKVGAEGSGTPPVLWTLTHVNCEVSFMAQHQPSHIMVFWNNSRVSSENVIQNGEEVKINIPREAKKHLRSFLRVYAWNDAGLGNDVLIPLQYGKVVTNPDLLTRYDHHKAIMYNVFVDRFFNGDPDNDKRLPDSIVHPRANYHGGDLAGVLQKLQEGYFEELGVNTLWLSPVVKNTDTPFGWWSDPPTKFSAYHGYWPISFTEIDTHFGQPEDLSMLVSTAHSTGVNILLDFVANHVHQEHPYFVANPGIATPLKLPDGSLNLERWDEHRLTTWFDVFLPSLDLEQEKIAQTVSDSVLWWVTQYHIDGFRHDAAKHIPLTFWRMLTRKIRNQVTYPLQRPILQMGETYGSAGLIGSYLGSGMLDAQFDFNLFDAALGAFAGGQDFVQLSRRINESFSTYGWHSLMGNITGNQDRGRFISYAGGDLLFSENAKKAGWTRDIGVGDPVAYDKLKMMMAFIMTLPGIPVIYYGDEIGLAGGNDPDCRRMMRFGDALDFNERKLLEVTRRLAYLRNYNMAMMYGDFQSIEIRKNTMTLTRTYFGNTVIVVFNNSADEQVLKISSAALIDPEKFMPNFGAAVVNQHDEFTVTLKPWSFELLTKPYQHQ
jgi:cyclomaltodextrinase / maltogenic alpha-amylase / neopullulanase